MPYLDSQEQARLLALVEHVVVFLGLPCSQLDRDHMFVYFQLREGLNDPVEVLSRDWLDYYENIVMVETHDSKSH